MPKLKKDEAKHLISFEPESNILGMAIICSKEQKNEDQEQNKRKFIVVKESHPPAPLCFLFNVVYGNMLQIVPLL